LSIQQVVPPLHLSGAEVYVGAAVVLERRRSGRQEIRARVSAVADQSDLQKRLRSRRVLQKRPELRGRSVQEVAGLCAGQRPAVDGAAGVVAAAAGPKVG